MRCPRCGGRSKVYKTQQQSEGLEVIRWRQCQAPKCAARFNTREREARKETRWAAVSRVRI